MTDEMLTLFRESINKAIEEWKAEGIEAAEIEQRVQRILQGKAVFKAFDSCCEQAVQYLQENMYTHVMEQRAMSAEFTAQHEQIWSEAFVTSEAMYIMAVESGELCSRYAAEHMEDLLTDKRNKVHALKALHIRACQQYAEIIHLIKGGFADGALARWRSLYELCVVAKFIADHDENVAQAYIDKGNWDNGYHDWAKAVPKLASKKGHVSFSKIQENCSFSTEAYKKLYKFACKYVHAAPMGTFTRVGRKYREQVLAGRSDYGMTGPAEQAALALAVISYVYYNQLLFLDGVAYAEVMFDWVEVVSEAYEAAEKEAFSDEE